MASDIIVPVSAQPADSDFEARLAREDITYDACIATMNGQEVPWALGSPLIQYCLIRGIRHHDGFGKDIRSATPAFTRAWNAQRIMNNSIPDIDMSNPEEHTPYCIWYPKVASESAYRALAQRYPHMKYQVARACAVAGYTNLYHELDVLPEVHIAEEARDNGHLSIFNSIISSPLRYAIMDDYTRTINLANPQPGAFLNGDTAVRSSLLLKRKIEMPYLSYPFCDGCHPSTAKINGPIPPQADGNNDGWHFFSLNYPFKPSYFNITEDASIDIYSGVSPASENPPLSPDLISPLLYSPLPRDLPQGDKNILILMAAYNGDIDRYHRLKRPRVSIPKQIACIMRGIYHNTLFAKYWADRLVTYPKTYRSKEAEEINIDGLCMRYIEDIHKAIHARYIMVNNLGLIDQSTPEWYLPYCIWYPGIPARETLKELVRRQPKMRQAAARACIVAGAGYTALFDEFDPEPDAALIAEAEACRVGNFKEFFGRKMESLGQGFVPRGFLNESWKMLTWGELAEPSFGFMAMTVLRRVDETCVDSSFMIPGVYEGHSVYTGTLELSVGGRDLLLADGQERVELEDVYARLDEAEGQGDS